MRYLPVALLGATLSIACGGEDLVLPAEGEPASVAIVQGNGQTAKVGAALDDSLVVRVTDTRDRPVADATVAFVLVDGSGQITIDGGQLTPDTVRTDADGRAASHWTLGASAGTQRAEARVVGAANPLIAKFTATAEAGRAAALAAVSGDKQSAPAGAPLPDSLVVRASDAAGNPVAGAPVTWSVTGGGSVSATTTATNADGLTAVQRILGPNAGAQAAVARTVGVSAPVIFTATATAGSAANISIVSGNNQSAAPASPLPAPLVVRIVDADGNGVPGRSVAWVIGQGGGSASPATSKTDANGQASTGWTLGPAAGTNTLTAVVSDVGSVVFTATGTAAPPPPPPPPPTGPSGSRSGVSASPTTFVAGQGSSNVTVTVRDAGGNPLSGVAVTIAVSGGGNTITQPNGSTNSSGVATGSFTSSVAGDKTVSASAGGVAIVQTVAVSVTAPPPPPPSATGLTVATQPSSTAVSGVPFAQQPVVQLVDGSGNPIGTAGITVTASIASGGGTLGGTTSQMTDGNGRATFTDLSITGAAGKRTLGFSAPGLTGATSAPIDVSAAPPSPDAGRTTAMVPKTGTVGVATDILVQSRDKKGHEVKIGGALVVVDVSGANTAGPLTAADQGDGTYTAAYTPTAAGKDAVAITLNGDAISGSPYTTVVAEPEGSATRLGFLTEPKSAKVDQPIAPPVQVAVEDHGGEVVTSAVATITVGLGRNRSGGTLSGTVAQEAVNGVATFDDLMIDREGRDYTVVATSPDLAAAESAAFRVRD